jgi:ATP-dependent RNA helicase SUPV3L1/SUV3
MNEPAQPDARPYRPPRAGEGLDIAPGRVVAVLGPTNTGKTHFAVERLLGHRSGVIGLPLRLLAREIYDRVAAVKGANSVALVTGEEKIVPAEARYFICTVEAMPLERSFEFLAVDEIQLAADPERGHVFTDRLLHARGTEETIFLGAETIKPLMRQLLPRADYVTRPRLSALSWAGPRKLSRLPRRSAIVAFSADEVYALAEMVRRQRGGAAVVMGALSPRTRNAQVALYQAGEVDYLVATDAIGMGLNMDVDHVAFASRRKFDGRQFRDLHATEIAQIAGRAGRHMNDGTFGTTSDAEPFDPEIVDRVENHRFDALKALQWRNSAVDFSSVAALIRSLEVPPPAPGLARVREAEDLMVLRALSGDPDISAAASAPDTVALLWDVCQIPDFRKTMADVHARLLARIFGHLVAAPHRLPADWVEDQLARLDRTEGDIDTLATRLAHVRTWAYVSHRRDWLADAERFQEACRAIEDRLSDALHEALTQRFVDRRSSVLLRRLADDADMMATVDAAGDVLVEGEYVGRLTGFRFQADPRAEGPDGRALRSAANRALGPEIATRANRLADAADAAFTLDDQGRVHWEESVVGRVVGGRAPLEPRVELAPNELLEGPARERVRQRLQSWIESRIATVLAPLVRLDKVELKPQARGLAFRLGEALGTLSRAQTGDDIAALPKEERWALRGMGVAIGRIGLYMPALLKPEPTRLKLILWAAHKGLDLVPPAPPPGLVSLAAGTEAPEGYWPVAGYKVCGARAIRLDMLDRLETSARKLAQAAPNPPGPVPPTPELMGLIGATGEDFAAAMRAIGFKPDVVKDEATGVETRVYVVKGPGPERPRRREGAEGAERGPRRRRGRRPEGQRTEAQPATEANPAVAPGEGTPAPPAEGERRHRDQRRGKGQGQAPRREHGPKKLPPPPKVSPDSPFAVLAALRDRLAR